MGNETSSLESTQQALIWGEFNQVIIASNWPSHTVSQFTAVISFTKNVPHFFSTFEIRIISLDSYHYYFWLKKKNYQHRKKDEWMSKKQDVDRSFENNHWPLWPNDNPVWFKFIMENNANSGNLSVPGHMIQKIHSSGWTFSILWFLSFLAHSTLL